jgi:hypothetical protein
MKKLIIFLLCLCLFSCGKSVISSRDSIVKSVEINTEENLNKETYIVYAEYIGESVKIISPKDGRAESKGFTLYTNKKYTIGDTIRLAQ